jgi:hypothetical protein
MLGSPFPDGVSFSVAAGLRISKRYRRAPFYLAREEGLFPNSRDRACDGPMMADIGMP